MKTFKDVDFVIQAKFKGINNRYFDWLFSSPLNNARAALKEEEKFNKNFQFRIVERTRITKQKDKVIK